MKHLMQSFLSFTFLYALLPFLILISCTKEDQNEGIEYVKPTFTLTSPSQAALTEGYLPGSMLNFRGTASDNRRLEKITLVIKNNNTSAALHSTVMDDINEATYSVELDFPIPADTTPGAYSIIITLQDIYKNVERYSYPLTIKSE